jgi:F-type H+-transporting ATPase subunit delta
MTEYKVSFRYAKAVIESAIKENLTDVLLNDFNLVKGIVISSKELKTFLKSPVIPETKKKKIISELFENQVNASTLNFLLFLVTKGRANLIIDIISQYEVQYNQLHGRIKVGISTAIEMNDDIKTKIVQKITDYTMKTVLPEFKIEESLKGGIVVQVEDWVFDGSLKSQLENLYNSLSKN